MAISPPTALALTRSIKSINLAWSASATAGVQYAVYRDRGANGYFLPIAIDRSETSYIDFNVSPGVVYRYFVVATLAGAESAPTGTVQAIYIGPKDDYGVRDAAVPATTVAAGVVKAGCGEFQRLQKLRGRAIGCGK
jgi:hypothetical protein